MIAILLFAILAFALGASVGSFLNVVSDRVPRGVSIVTPRSFCDKCKRTLESRELIPVLSYLWLRGKCKECGVSIPLRVWLVEVVTGSLFTVAYFRYGSGMEFAIVCVALALMVAISVIDLEHRLILNSIIFPTLLVLLIIAPFWPQIGFERGFLDSHGMLASFANSVLAGFGVSALFLMLALAVPQGMGMGDVKLTAVIGLMVGFPGVVVAIWLGIVIGGIVAVLLLILKLRGRKDLIPFGPFLSVGAIIALLAGTELTSKYQEFSANILFWT